VCVCVCRNGTPRNLLSVHIMMEQFKGENLNKVDVLWRGQKVKCGRQAEAEAGTALGRTSAPEQKLMMSIRIDAPTKIASHITTAWIRVKNVNGGSCYYLQGLGKELHDQIEPERSRRGRTS
jgi:hypothetical protein